MVYIDFSKMKLFDKIFKIKINKMRINLTILLKY